MTPKSRNALQATDPDKARERDAKFKAGEPEIFEFPSPRLGPGVLHDDTAPVGQPFPQPVLADGELLDQYLGNRFAVIGRAELLDWLDSHDVGAVMLRPDRYILGQARTPGELDAVTACLPVADVQAH